VAPFGSVGMTFQFKKSEIPANTAVISQIAMNAQSLTPEARGIRGSSAAPGISGTRPAMPMGAARLGSTRPPAWRIE